MCRACGETPDGQGRRCPGREDGFTPVESQQRNRLRGLKSARDALTQGDPQGAANSLVHAVAAQRELDGGYDAPVQDPEPEPGSHRDFIVSPSSTDKAVGLVNIVNAERERAGKEPLGISLTRQHRRTDDPLVCWEQVTMRVSGGTDDELQRLNISGDVKSSAEKVVSTFGVLEASCAAVRLDGKYVPRSEGGPSSTPARVEAYLADEPNSPMRQAMRPTTADQSMAREVRSWIRLQPVSNDYVQSLRHAVAEDYMSHREVGVASSAIAGYMRHKSELERARAEGTPVRPVPERQRATRPSQQHNPRRSRFLGTEGEQVYLAAKVEKVHPIYHEQRADPHFLYLMRTPEGDAVRWMASNDQGLERDDEITLRGTVKGHSTFNGEKQTEVYYCRPTIHNAHRVG